MTTIVVHREWFVQKLGETTYPEQRAAVRQLLIDWLDLNEQTPQEAECLRVLEALPPPQGEAL